MAWIEGKQEIRRRELPEKEWERQFALEGFLEEDVAKIELYKYFRENLSVAASLLMGVNLFPHQHIMLRTNFEADYVLNIIARAGGKSWIAAVFVGLYALMNPGVKIGIISSVFRQCLTGDAMVLTDKGLKPLRDIEVGDIVVSKNGKNGVKSKWKNEKSDGLELISKRGYSITGKKEHRCLVLDEENYELVYKELHEISKGDFVVISGKNSFGDFDVSKERVDNGNKKALDIFVENKEDFYYYLGLLYGDGTINLKNHCFTITTKDSEIRDFVTNYIKKISPKSSVNPYKRQKSGCYDIRFSSVAYSKLMNKMGVEAGQKAISKKIPEKLLLASGRNIAAFLSGLFDTDGTVENGKTSTMVGLSTSSKTLAKQVQNILLEYGIISSLTVESARGKIRICGVDTIGREAYKIRILDRDSLINFEKHIGFRLSRKRNKLKSGIGRYKRMTSKRYFPSPRKFVERKYGTRWGAKVFSRKSGITAKEIRSVLSKNLLIEEGDKEKILSLLDEGVIFDKVKDIRKVEDIETYDIEVENEHCYVANGFINHNSKQIFKYLEEIADKKGAELFKSCISKVEHKNDEYSIRIGDSVIYALPLGDGQKLRGFRFNLIVIDELLLMPKKVVNEVILPFLGAVQNPDKRRALRLAEDELVERGLMKEEDRYVWPSNKLIGLSSASYKFDYLYELYQVYEALIMGEAINKNDESLKDIARKNSRRAIVHMSYEAIPEDVYDQDLLAQSKATFSEAGFAREFKAEFTDDSSGFFRISKMNLCTVDDGMEPSVEVKGDPNAKYLLAIDPSWAENEESDHFAMQLLKLNEEKEIATVVHSYAIAGGKVKDHARYLLYLLQNFNIVMIWADYAGGLQFINTCNESALFTDEKIKLTIMEEAFDPDEHYLESLRKGKVEYNEKSGYRVVLRKFSSDWIRKANELLQAHFDHRKIWFGARCMDDTYTKQTKQSIPINDIKFIEEDSYEEKGSSKMIDFVERQSECISLTKTECALIQVKTSPQGTQVFDLPDNLKRNKGKNRTRRDSYTALVIGNWGAKVYFDMIKAEEVQEMTDFEPIFIG